MTVRVRGIYTTALTALLDDVVQASPPIQRRFDEEFPLEPAAASVTTTDDRQGVCVTGASERVTEIVKQLEELGRDAFVWRAALPRGAVFAGEVVETLGSGALVECDGVADGEPDGVPAAGDTQGFLPYSKTSRRIEEGETLRVQVDEPRAPWSGSRPVLETTVRVHGELASLVRGKSSGSGQPELAEILPVDPPEGWGTSWADAADDAGLDALGDTLEGLRDRALAFDDSLADAGAVEDVAPGPYWPGETTCWVWFGRESRFALDAVRRDAVPTMPGHHRTKAGTNAASAAVDFVEALCDDLGDTEAEFPFGVVTDQFGPQAGDSVRIDHGKPDGRLFDLGTGEVTERDADGQVTVRREMSPGGTYDALGVERQAGDVAITKFKEGRWWYPTVYRGEDGQTRGTYVNVCTPVEVFPDAVRYVDLHVDVVKHADGTVERVDDDELDAATEVGHISPALAEKARAVADAIAKSL
ncbi:Ribonuclease G or E [Halovenus aranensis]|uniref:Probable ribonuclease FAU-1 n=1 Tax=Halovenus aranensis TaxID=890420 RepID=A0A1G8XQ07_9EURY|nr:DUF402 domain-containing protein [Halovenus aranensis]SDJ92567.1 Ribonuclease G or E [Halovenus aranensis]